MNAAGLPRRIATAADNTLEMAGFDGRAEADPRRLREAELRRAVLRGDETAWRALYNDAFEPLFAYVQWRSGGWASMAEDVVQETWLVAVRRLRDFDPAQGSFLHWLRGIAANVIRNQLRGQRRHPSQSLDGVDVPARSDLEARERAERIARTLDALPSRQEAVLRAKYLDQQSVAQIAALWGETEKAIESLLTRARQAFREAHGEPEPCEGIQSLE